MSILSEAFVQLNKLNEKPNYTFNKKKLNEDVAEKTEVLSENDYYNSIDDIAEEVYKKYLSDKPNRYANKNHFMHYISAPFKDHHVYYVVANHLGKYKDGDWHTIIFNEMLDRLDDDELLWEPTFYFKYKGIDYHIYIVFGQKRVPHPLYDVDELSRTEEWVETDIYKEGNKEPISDDFDFVRNTISTYINGLEKNDYKFIYADPSYEEVKMKMESKKINGYNKKFMPLNDDLSISWYENISPIGTLDLRFITSNGFIGYDGEPHYSNTVLINDKNDNLLVTTENSYEYFKTFYSFVEDENVTFSYLDTRWIDKFENKEFKEKALAKYQKN